MGTSSLKLKKIESILPQFDSIFNRINFTDIVDFTRQMAIMLNAGLTLIDCFNILEKQIKKTELLPSYKI